MPVPKKACPACGERCPVASRRCISCEHIFLSKKAQAQANKEGSRSSRSKSDSAVAEQQTKFDIDSIERENEELKHQVESLQEKCRKARERESKALENLASMEEEVKRLKKENVMLQKEAEEQRRKSEMFERLASERGEALKCLQVKQGSATVRMSVPDEDIKQRILTLPGPYCSSKRVYNSFSSSSRPTPQRTEGYMRELETASLGQVKKLGKSTVFYKAIPNTLIHSEHHLGNLNVSLDQFKDNFLKADDLLTSSQKESMLDNHPKLQELREYFRSQNVEL